MKVFFTSIAVLLLQISLSAQDFMGSAQFGVGIRLGDFAEEKLSFPHFMAGIEVFGHIPTPLDNKGIGLLVGGELQLDGFSGKSEIKEAIVMGILRNYRETPYFWALRFAPQVRLELFSSSIFRPFLDFGLGLNYMQTTIDATYNKVIVFRGFQPGIVAGIGFNLFMGDDSAYLKLKISYLQAGLITFPVAGSVVFEPNSYDIQSYRSRDINTDLLFIQLGITTWF